MKGILLRTNNYIDAIDFGETIELHDLQNAVNGYIEIVYAVGLPRGYVMVVNEEGLLRDLEPNLLASLLYGVKEHGQIIVGNALILRDIVTQEGDRDLGGLSEDDIRNIGVALRAVIG